MKVQVVKPWVSDYPDPIVLIRLDRVDVDTGRTSEWPGWTWCRSSSGKAGWVPDAYLSVDEYEITVNRDYSARELTVSVGEVLSVHEELAGWVWCERDNGEPGWVPLQNVIPYGSD